MFTSQLMRVKFTNQEWDLIGIQSLSLGASQATEPCGLSSSCGTLPALLVKATFAGRGGTGAAGLVAKHDAFLPGENGDFTWGKW